MTGRNRLSVLVARIGAILTLLLLAAASAQAGVVYIEAKVDSVIVGGSPDGLNGAQSVAMSPDGAHVYVGGNVDKAISIFSRDSSTGILSYVGVVLNAAAGSSLDRVRGVVVSPDGAHVYATGNLSRALSVYDRNAATGLLTYKAKYTDGASGGGGTLLDGAWGVDISPDGANVYVASASDSSVTVFSRDLVTGLLTWVEAFEDGAPTSKLAGAESVVVSPDGANVYVAAQDNSAVTVFTRNPSTGRLTFLDHVFDGEAQPSPLPTIDGLDGCQAVVVSPDGAHVYTAAGGTDNAIAVFDRNSATGALTFRQAYKDSAAPPPPLSNYGLLGAEWLAISPSGTSVYAVSAGEKTLTVFNRNAATGALTLIELHQEGTGSMPMLDGASAVVVGVDNRHVYVAADADDAINFFRSTCGDGDFDAGEQCDDGNVVNGACCSSTCTNEPAGSVCADDGELCTDDKCNGAGFCLHVNNTAQCDDLDPCTSNDRCANRECNGTPMDCSGLSDACHVGQCDPETMGCVAVALADGSPCDDANACTVGDSCQAGVCVSGAPVVCTPLDQCHDAGVCDPLSGVCSDEPKADGTGCDDGSLCTELDTCIAGTCVGQEPVMCTASDQCHEPGDCNPATGVCSNPALPTGTACNDGDACTQTDTCQTGICTGANPKACTALDQCHNAGECDPATGVCSNPDKASGSMCDDGNLCTDSDRCVSGTCVGDPVVCVPQDQCQIAGVCNPATGQCSTPDAPNGTPCDDGDLCTQSDSCLAGICIGANPVTCTAQDQCHVAGTCNPATGQCSNPPAADQTPCVDGSLCTQGDHCEAGACVGTSTVICTASDQCHQSGVCNPATGLCMDPPKPNGSPCDDGSLCTSGDSCQAGVCTGNPVVCTALDDCHQAGVCDPATGVCSNPPQPNGTTCEDGNRCTQSGSCDGAGTCIGSDPITCTAQDQCHVAGVCDPVTGLCSNPPKANGATCDDGSACTQSDTCQTGVCTGANPIVCTAQDQCHVTGTCDPATGVCSNPAQTDGVACDDGNPCTLSDTCQAGTCTAGAPKTCLPLDGCHDAGVCDPATGLCSNPPKPDETLCEDGSLCTRAGTCQSGTCVGSDPVVCTAQDQCHDIGVCDPATGMCSNPAKTNGTTCDDGSRCTQSDTCQAGICTGADPVVCAPQDQCHDAGVCDPGTGLCSNPPKAEGAACEDGNACTLLDTCQAGACVSGAPVTCAAIDACHTAGVCDPATGVCTNPTQPDGTACNDASACTLTDTCQGGTCTGANSIVCTAQDQCHDTGVCNPLTGLCSNPPKADDTTCDDGNPCTLDDTCQAGTCVPGAPMTCLPLDACHDAGVCDPATGQCSTPTKANGTPCEDGNLCTLSGACSNGACVGTDPVACAAQDQCHEIGVCDPATGLCSNPQKADGASCEDGDRCTQASSCSGGTCVGGSPVVCAAVDACHFDGVCDPATGLCSTPARPDQVIVTFDSVADTFTDNTDATTQTQNFGAGQTLKVDRSPTQRIFMRFAPTGIDGLTVESAVVQMRVDSQSSSGSDFGGRIHAISDVTWDELTVTHANAPAVDGPALSSLGAVALNQVVTFDVTAAISGDGPVSFAIEPLSTNGAIYDSREAGVGGPQLVIRLAIPCDDGSACTDGDQCTAGQCVGVNVVTCPPASDQCHENGVCDPATGTCLSPLKADGVACEDGDLCTTGDACEDGECVTGAPVVCTGDECHVAGACNPATGQCVDPAKLDGTPCEDGDLCTQGGSCIAGTCVGNEPVICVAQDQCHVVGICNPATGTCSNPAKADGASCNDGDLCTRTDTCIGGTCTAGMALVCAAFDQCRASGVCNPATGTCTSPAKADGTGCDDGNACTQSDTCRDGRCVGANPVVCAAADACHEAGTCNPATGTCSKPAKPEGAQCDDRAFCTVGDVCHGGVCAGTPRQCGPAAATCQASVCDEVADACVARTRADGATCDDGDVCTADDVCIEGACVGDPRDDGDDDGICDPIDVCPLVSDPAQSDGDGDGVGDLCQCTAPAPGRCVVGGGSKRTDCLVEFLPSGPPSLNRAGTKMKPMLRCSDGDPTCDLDGSRDGTCTFGVSMCFANGDPRLPACTPDAVGSAEVQRPSPRNGDANAMRLEQALASLGLEVRRRGQVVAPQIAPLGLNMCGPMTRLTVPAPAGAKPVRLKFQLRGTAIDGRADADRFVLSCE